MDKFIVRLSAIVLNLYILLSALTAYYGTDISVCDFIFTDSLLFGILLSVLCHKQGRYHCVWMRALCYNLVLIPIVNFIDGMFVLFDTAESLIYTIVAVTMSSTILTISMAVNHFYKVRKSINKRKSEGFKGFEPNK